MVGLNIRVTRDKTRIGHNESALNLIADIDRRLTLSGRGCL